MSGKTPQNFPFVEKRFKRVKINRVSREKLKINRKSARLLPSITQDREHDSAQREVCSTVGLLWNHPQITDPTLLYFLVTSSKFVSLSDIQSPTSPSRRLGHVHESAGGRRDIAFKERRSQTTFILPCLFSFPSWRRRPSTNRECIIKTPGLSSTRDAYRADNDHSVSSDPSERKKIIRNHVTFDN